MGVGSSRVGSLARLQTCRIDPLMGVSTKGLRSRNSPTCTLSQNGYGDDTLDSLPMLNLCSVRASLVVVMAVPFKVGATTIAGVAACRVV